jgi:hypothetical protein
MASVLTDNRCVICGIPLDAEFFDVSGLIGKPLGKQPGDEALFDPFKDFEFEPIADLPRRGEQKVLATFQLHVQYCGAITYFSQYTDLYMRDNSQIQTPGFEWLIMQNGKPVFPYTRLERIINPWGYNCFPIFIRLDENAKVDSLSGIVRSQMSGWTRTNIPWTRTNIPWTRTNIPSRHLPDALWVVIGTTMFSGDGSGKNKQHHFGGERK